MRERRPVAHVVRHDEEDRRQSRKRNVLGIRGGKNENRDKRKAVDDSGNGGAPAVFDVCGGAGYRARRGNAEKERGGDVGNA